MKQKTERIKRKNRKASWNKHNMYKTLTVLSDKDKAKSFSSGGCLRFRRISLKRYKKYSYFKKEKFLEDKYKVASIKF